MAKLKSFSNTSISAFKTQDDLEKLLAKYGIPASRWTHFAQVKEEQDGRIQFEFESDGRPYRVTVSYRKEVGPNGGSRGTTREQAARAIFWHVKNLFDAVDFGIVTLEEAFLPYMLGPGGKTVFEHIKPRLGELQSISPFLALTEGVPA